MRPSPDERTLYLVCIRFESLRFIDLESGETVDSIAGQFSGSAISPDGRLLYAVTTSKRLITIDMDSREVVSDIELELPASPSLLKQMVSVSPQGARLYVGLGREDNDDDSGSQDVHEIAIIDLASGSTVDVFETAYQIDGKGLAVGRDGAVYVNTSSQIVQLFPDEYDPVVIHDGVEIRQFLVSRLAD
jgi:DNA-binding beta-propeller fold protein YncE